MKLPRKILVFIWRVLNDAIPTNFLLHKRGIHSSIFCDRCDLDLVEDSVHVMFRCSRAEEVWLRSVFRDYWVQFQSLCFWDAIKFFWQVQCGQLLPYFLVMCWFIWWDRNKWKFEQQNLEAEVLVLKASSFMQNFIDQELSDVGQKPVTVVRWRNPVAPWLRINVDAAVPCESNFKGLGMVGRKCDGSIFLGMAKRVVGAFSAEIAEAYALLEAVKESVCRGFRMVEFETDCLKIVNLLNSSEHSLRS